MSRESALLANNVLLLVAAGSVLLGTLYPLFLDALALGKISVGPPYFEAVFVPLMAPLAFLMGIGPIARWKQASLPDLWSRLRWALGVAAVTALVLPAATGKWSPFVSFGLGLALWIVAATVVGARERIRNARGGLVARLAQQPRAWWGMTVAHLGIAVFITGVTLVKGYETERDVRMAIGDTVTVGGYAFRFAGVRDAAGPELSRGARDGRGEQGRPSGPYAPPRKARLQRAGNADDRGRDRERGARRPVRLARRSGRATAPGRCASTTSRS